MPRSKVTLPGGSRISDFVTMGVLTKSFPAEAVQESVRIAGRASIRNRQLPAQLVVLYCMALWLFRDVAYENVLDCVLESYRWLGLPGSQGATKGAISQARSRLGPEPMRLLFERTAVPIAVKATQGAWYRGRRLVALDGTLFDAPDTAENGAEFGYPTNQKGKGPFPKVRVAVLAETSTHVPFGCAIGTYTTSELELGRQLVGKLKPDMLLLADRLYFGPLVWKEFSSTGAMLVWRVQKQAPVEVLERLKDGSYAGCIRHEGSEIPVRVVIYQIEGSKEQNRLVTNELDPEKAPAIELAKLYTERWEIELVFDEIKSHISESRLALRSKKPDLIKQEIWGLLLLHWALRDLMHDAAIANARDPDTVSFVQAVRLVKLHFHKDGDISP